MNQSKNKKNVWIWICVIMGILLLAGGIAARFWWGEEAFPIYGHMLMGGWMMPLGMIGMVCFWGLVLFAIVRGLNRGGSCCGKTDSEHVLKDRLARGEITIEEYEAIVQKIKGE